MAGAPDGKLTGRPGETGAFTFTVECDDGIFPPRRMAFTLDVLRPARRVVSGAAAGATCRPSAASHPGFE